MMKDTIYFAKVKETAVIPSKRYEDGCYDVYACFDEDELTIQPSECKLIPTGIASACPPKYRFALRERGSTGTKCMSVRAGQIDSGYRGEWFVPINNTGDISKKYDKVVKGYVGDVAVTFYPYSKAICQVALEEVPDVHIKKISYEDLCKMESIRGTSCLGDSGK